MEAAFQMVRQVVVFLLLAALLTNLFMGTEYKKYFTYVTSLIVILLVLHQAQYRACRYIRQLCRKHRQYLNQFQQDNL